MKFGIMDLLLPMMPGISLSGSCQAVMGIRVASNGRGSITVRPLSFGSVCAPSTKAGTLPVLCAPSTDDIRSIHR